MSTNKPRLTTDSDARKEIPIASGCLDYFPDALAAVAELSYVGNQKHNPGQPLQWARGKSTDEADCLIRHFLERGTVDTDGIRHSAKVAWRALALLQKEIEAAKGLPISRGSVAPEPASPSTAVKAEVVRLAYQEDGGEDASDPNRFRVGETVIFDEEAHTVEKLCCEKPDGSSECGCYFIKTDAAERLRLIHGSSLSRPKSGAV